MRPYFPGGILIALAATREGLIPHTSSIHRLQHGLPGYLILFAPHAFAPQCQSGSSQPLSPPVFLLISTNFTSTPGIPLTSNLSRTTVPKAFPKLSSGLSPLAYRSTYTPFTPSDSEQRLRPTYYRGCWHVVSRRFFLRYRHNLPSDKELYDPKAFFIHAALLRQAFAHCAKFPTAASRRSLARISVPVWRIILSDPLPIIALRSHYLPN